MKISLSNFFFHINNDFIFIARIFWQNMENGKPKYTFLNGCVMLSHFPDLG